MFRAVSFDSELDGFSSDFSEEEDLEEEAMDTIDSLSSDVCAPSDEIVPPRRRCYSTSCMPRRMPRPGTPPLMARSGNVVQYSKADIICHAEYTIAPQEPTENRWSDPVQNQKCRVIKDKLDICLQEILPGLMHRELGIVDFIKQVYDFEPQRITKKEHLTLLETSCMAFCNADDEFGSCIALEEMIEDLKGQLLPDVRTAPLVLNLSACGKRSPQGGHGHSKPDFFLSTRRVDRWTRCRWMAGLGYGIVRRSEEWKERSGKVKYTNYAIDLDVLMKVSIA